MISKKTIKRDNLEFNHDIVEVQVSPMGRGHTLDFMRVVRGHSPSGIIHLEEVQARFQAVLCPNEIASDPTSIPFNRQASRLTVAW